MKSKLFAFAGTVGFFVCTSLIGHGQEVAAPTSTEVSKTLIPIFPAGEISGIVQSQEAYSNFRMVVEYDVERAAYVQLVRGYEVELPAGKNRRVEITYEHTNNNPAHVSVWVDGFPVEKGRDLADVEIGDDFMVSDVATSTELMRLDRDFTMMVSFISNRSDGPLFAKSKAEGNWSPDSKGLFIRDGRLVYEIAGLGVLEGKTKIETREKQVVVIVSQAERVSMFLNGQLEASKEKFAAMDLQGSVFKIGKASPDKGEDYTGRIASVRFWTRGLDLEEVKNLSNGNEKSVNTPDLNWHPESNATETKFGNISGYAIRPKLEVLGMPIMIHSALVQPLATADHAAVIRGWDEKSLERGEKIYSQLCMTCHGTLDQPGSLPTAPRFHLGEFKNGADPYRMFETLEKGYGQMVAQPQYNTAQKYDIIHYLREHFLKDKNEKAYFPVDDAYLSQLPRGMNQLQEKTAEEKAPQYELQDYGNAMFWTMEVEKGNIAQKGIAIRLDEGAGGVSKGKAWMLYEHDTMRLAACWTGEKFIDWKGIAFDGSHGTHTSIVGEKHFISPNQPMWANPETGDFKDLRILGRDGLSYGPLPRDWVHFKGMEIHGENPVIRYSVGDCDILEIPKLGENGAFERLLYCGPSSKELKLRLDGKKVHIIPASEVPFQFGIRYQDGKVTVFSESGEAPPAEYAVSKRFEKTLTTSIKVGESQGAWAYDILEAPDPKDNPWQSWMRTSGFDFFEGGNSAAVCTWDGDVWIVDGIAQSEGELKWQRICSGLFQPLGLKIINGQIYVGCRDMIAILRDTNGDRETDFIENFNSDHQVTEHFHEFAMGLQADAEGNLYYAKSARHGKPGVVPHHGTLLKVSKDGSKTEILATGFRAANGICLNPDGSFMVTDQEGNWTPKNRINWVKPNAKNNFYGNMWGFHSVTDTADSAMNQPLCWITNRFDRSPAELLWVPEDSAWKSLRGSLLNLSYGEGKIYTVPFEKIGDQVQGGMSDLPVGPMPTGIMRGRFNPLDGQLYTCGMFAWAGNRQQPSGFYRVRYTGNPAHQPIALRTAKGEVTIGLSDPLDPESVANLEAWNIQTWDLERTENYGSKHSNERSLKLVKASLSKDGKTVTLSLPELAPTWGMSIQMKLKGANGEQVDREIHNSIYTLK